MKLAFAKFAGLASGGVEKYLQTIAIIMKNAGHDVDYYYTNAAPITTTSWVHPDNDEKRKKLMEENDINLIYVNVHHRENNTWVGDDFFEKFNEDDYDFLITAGNGEPEYPYVNLKNIKIIHTVHGWHPFDQDNIVKSVLISEWQSEKWIANGGNKDKLEIIPGVVLVPEKQESTVRKELNIPEEDFVYGLHQRNDEGITSLVSLQAFSMIDRPDVHFILLGGSNRHRQYASTLQNKNIHFLEHTSNVDRLHDFLGSLDVYAHARIDGEVCSACITEAMYHGTPVVTHPGLNMGHLEQIKDGGKMCSSVNEYYEEMLKLKDDKEYYNDKSMKIIERYESVYKFESVRDKLLTMLNLL